MSNTSTNANTQRAVSDEAKPRTETEDKLWQALQATPDSTAAALSTVAAIGKSTAGKILARWEKCDLVARTAGIAGGGSRPADRWSIAPDEQLDDDVPMDKRPPVEQPKVIGEQGADGGQQTKPKRLAPGALRGLVEDYLRDNPGMFSPNTIGKALSRSSGAVHNALEKLVDDGYAVRISEKPRKYAIAPAAEPAAISAE